ncbi:acylneuraminate cytidylyltransferase [Alphaproteobacteria bacterium]|nr:acylneuraminate cytidylyltransferase [Alphaproteobacteria bacterium]
MNIGIILARGGSKSIPQKNVREVGGRPLIHWVMRAACASEKIDQVIVSTDSDDIAKVVSSYGSEKVTIFARSALNASDVASSEDALFEVISELDLSAEDTIVFLQATSPLTEKKHVDAALDFYNAKRADSLLSVVRQKRFIWDSDGNPDNYNLAARPRRQDFEGYLVENGALYIFGVGGFLREKNRLYGVISMYEMPEESYYELDEPKDLLIIESLLSEKKSKGVAGDYKIKLFVSDIDGTLTDGGMYYSASGEAMKKFNTKDGKAFELLRAKGIRTCLITSEDTPITSSRAKKMGVDFVFQGKTGFEKKEMIASLCNDLSIPRSETAYIGDDLNCLEALRFAGLKACPGDAVRQVKSVPDIYICGAKGGKGAVREFADLIISNIELDMSDKL